MASNSSTIKGTSNWNLLAVIRYNSCRIQLLSGLSQDLDSRVSKMCFGGDRVSWQSNAERSALCGRGSGARLRAPEARGSRCSEMLSLAFPGTYFHYFIYWNIWFFSVNFTFHRYLQTIMTRNKANVQSFANMNVIQRHNCSFHNLLHAPLFEHISFVTCTYFTSNNPLLSLYFAGIACI